MATAERIYLQRQQWQQALPTPYATNSRWRTEQNRRRIRKTPQMWHFYWFVSGYNANFAVGKMYSRSRSPHTHTRRERHRQHTNTATPSTVQAIVCRAAIRSMLWMWMNKCTWLAAAPAFTTVYSPGCILFNAIRFPLDVCVMALAHTFTRTTIQPAIQPASHRQNDYVERAEAGESV